ncbi:MAG: carbohydrate kinase, partial [Bacteroidota bacterium]
VIVDFVAERRGFLLRDVPAFRKFAGGAAANVAVGLSRLGTRSAFIGRVGDDSFGRFLAGELRRNHVDTRGLLSDPKHKTRLAFVSLTSAGDRDFEFWEHQPADEQLKKRDFNRTVLRNARIVHFSSFLLLKEPSRSAVLQISRELKKEGRFVSFDPNIRLSLWRSKREVGKIMGKMIRSATILRLNADEARLLSGSRNIQNAARILRKNGPSIVAVTLGKGGCYFLTGNGEGFVAGFRVKAVDTTGCGDGFLAGLIDGIIKTGKDPDTISENEMRDICSRANAGGGITAGKRGVFNALPDRTAVQKFLAQHSKNR